MKLLQVVHSFPPESFGGTERHVERLCRALAERGHSCAVLAGSPESASAPALAVTRQDGLLVARYRGASRRPGNWSEVYDPAAEDLIGCLLTLLKPDLVHVHHWLRLTTNLVSLCAERAIPTVVTLHDQWTACPRIHRLKPREVFCDRPYTPTLCLPCVEPDPWVGEDEVARELVLRHRQMEQEWALAGAVLVPSPAQRAFLREITGLDEARLRVLPLGTVASLAPPASGSRPRFPLAPLALGYWGYLVPHKGVHLLLQAVRQLPEEAVEVHLFGTAPDPSYEEALRGLAEGHRVTFHGAFRPADLVNTPLDVAVFPSFAPETYSFTLDEAFQMGLPVIVSDRGALADRVGPAGLVFRNGEVTHLAEQIRRLLEDPGLLEDLRRARPKEGVIPMDEHVADLEKIYEETAGAAPPAPLPPRDWLPLLVHLNAKIQVRDAELEPLHARLAWLEASHRQIAAELDGLRRTLAERDALLAERSAQLDWAFHLLGQKELLLRDILDSKRWKVLTALSRVRAWRPFRNARS